MCVISGFHREVDENYALLSSHAASSGNFLPAFRDNLSLPPSRVNIRNADNKLPLLLNNAEERSYQMFYICMYYVYL
jgi:hypothetical protein